MKRKILTFRNFYAVFVKFMIDVVDWKGKRVNKEQVCCPVDFSEELIAVFKLKKNSNWNRT